MKLATKLALVLGTLTGIIVLVGVFSLYQMGRVNEISTNLAHNWLPSLRYVEEMNAGVSTFRNYEVLHIYATETAVMSKFTGEMKKISDNLAALRKKFEEYPMTSERRRQYNQFLQERENYMRVHQTIFDLSERLQTEKAINILLNESSDVYLKMSKLLAEIVDGSVTGANAASVEGDAAFNSAKTFVIGLLVLGVLAAVLATVLLIRATMRQLGKDPGELAAIALRVSKGDYNVDDGSPKIGVFGNIVNMVVVLKQNIDNARLESERARDESEKAQVSMLQADAASKDAQAKRDGMLRAADKLEEVVNIISSASEELSTQIEQSEHGAAQQAARVSETATAMEEMNSTVIEVARNASAASDVSSRTRDKAEGGARVVHQAVAGIELVQKDSLALKEYMVTLSQNAQAISQIMGVISDIADQTNLLALNAAIEAARAGEAGRGFAVVADEVRKLAEKTMSSTTDVGNAIKAIQQSAEKSMKQVDATVQNIEQATQLAINSGEALREIVGMVEGTADQVRAIATAAEQQSASSEEINQSINQVNSISNETARAMQEAARAVSDLARQAQVLGGLIEDMKAA